MQDILSPHAAKHGKEPHAPSRFDRDRLRVLLLGANLWVACVAWPALSTHSERGIVIAFETLCLGPLVLGALLDPNRAPGSHGGAARPLLLLAVFPAALSAAIGLRPESLNQRLFGPFALCLLALSLCAYGAAVAASLGRNVGAELRIKHVALGADPWDAAPEQRELPRRVFIALCAAGACAITLVAPGIGGYAALEQAWGDAAGVGGVLCAVVGGALGVTLLAVSLGDGLRVATAAPADTEPGLRTAWFLFLALLGAVTYFVVQP